MDEGGTTLGEYTEMLALINTDLHGTKARPVDAGPMFERFGITDSRWGQITTFWVGRIGADPHLGAEFGQRFVARMRELDDAWLENPTRGSST